MTRLICDEQPLEGGHLFLTEQRRIAAQPQIPHQVSGPSGLIAFLRLEVRFPHLVVQIVHECLSLQTHAVQLHFFELPILRHRNTAVVQQISVDLLIQGAMAVKEADMGLQLFGIEEGSFQGIEHILFILGQLVRILRVKCREVGIPQRPYVALNLHRACRQIDFVQKQPVLQMVFRMCQDPLSFYLKLADGNGFMHPRRQFLIHRVELIPIQNMWTELFTRIVAINLLREGGQRPQVDSISHFQHIEVVIADIHPQHVGNACPVACGRTHPDDIVVAPLEVHFMIVHQEIHDGIRMGATVENIADNM